MWDQSKISISPSSLSLLKVSFPPGVLLSELPGVCSRGPPCISPSKPLASLSLNHCCLIFHQISHAPRLFCILAVQSTTMKAILASSSFLPSGTCSCSSASPNQYCHPKPSLLGKVRLPHSGYCSLPRPSSRPLPQSHCGKSEMAARIWSPSSRCAFPAR